MGVGNGCRRECLQEGLPQAGNYPFQKLDIFVSRQGTLHRLLIILAFARECREWAFAYPSKCVLGQDLYILRNGFHLRPARVNRGGVILLAFHQLQLILHRGRIPFSDIGKESWGQRDIIILTIPRPLYPYLIDCLAACGFLRRTPDRASAGKMVFPGTGLRAPWKRCERLPSREKKFLSRRPPDPRVSLSILRTTPAVQLVPVLLFFPFYFLVGHLCHFPFLRQDGYLGRSYRSEIILQANPTDL